jgi:hypothetical protein
VQMKNKEERNTVEASPFLQIAFRF